MRSFTARSRRGNALLVLLGVIVVTFAVIATISYFYLRSRGGVDTDGPLLHVVTSGPFDHIVLEHGEVESSENVEIRCDVKARNSAGTSILEVRDEGEWVETGDWLVVLDSSALENEVKQQEVMVRTSESIVAQAKAEHESAVLAKTEYLEGTFKQSEREIESEIFVAEEDLRRATEFYKNSARLAAKGIVTSLQLEGDKFAVERARKTLENARGKLDVLRRYTKEKELKTLIANIDTALVKWENEKESHQIEVDKLEEIRGQIELCTLKAPKPGQVVHANKVSSRGGSEFVVEPGAMVREKQVIIRLPNPAKMQVSAKINESRITLVKEGMPVRVQIGAFESDRELPGRVTKVNKYAEPTSFFSSQVKEYATIVEILDPPDDLRSGMTAEVRIFVDHQDNAIQIPVQALHEHKGRIFCMVKTAQGYETRQLEIGSSNDVMVTLENNAVKEGEQVVLNPRQHMDLMDLPDLPDLETASPGDFPAASPSDEDGPSDERSPGVERPSEAGGPGGGPRRPGGRGPGGAGGGPGGGGGFNPAQIVTAIFGQFDSDGDGTISAEELAAIPEERKGRMLRADSDGDGQITRAEMISAMSAAGAGGGRPGGGRGGAGGAP